MALPVNPCDIRLPGGDLLPGEIAQRITDLSVLLNKLQLRRFTATSAAATNVFVDSDQVPSNRYWWVLGASCSRNDGVGGVMAIYAMPPDLRASPGHGNGALVPDNFGPMLAPAQGVGATGVALNRQIALLRPIILPIGWFLRATTEETAVNSPVAGTIVKLGMAFIEIDFSLAPPVL